MPKRTKCLFPEKLYCVLEWNQDDEMWYVVEAYDNNNDACEVAASVDLKADDVKVVEYVQK